MVALAEVDQVLVVVVAQGAQGLLLPYFLKIALALPDRADQHRRRLDDLLQLVLGRRMAGIEDVHSLVVGHDDDQQVLHFPDVAIDVLGHGAFRVHAAVIYQFIKSAKSIEEDVPQLLVHLDLLLIHRLQRVLGVEVLLLQVHLHQFAVLARVLEYGRVGHLQGILLAICPLGIGFLVVPAHRDLLRYVLLALVLLHLALVPVPLHVLARLLLELGDVFGQLQDLLVQVFGLAQRIYDRLDVRLLRYMGLLLLLDLLLDQQVIQPLDGILNQVLIEVTNGRVLPRI